MVQAVYGIDVIKGNVSEAVEIMTDAVLNPLCNPWEVEEAKEKLKSDLQKFKGNPLSELTEVSFLPLNQKHPCAQR